MKKVVSLATVMAISGSCVFAHDLYIWSSQDSVFKADMIYGHNFPVPEKVADDRLSLFSPVVVLSEDGQKIEAQRVGDNNWHYELKHALPNGTYITYISYKPTAWINKTDGSWEMNKTRKDSKDVKSCSISSMFGKSVLVVGEKESDFGLKPINKGLEFVPMSKVSNIKAGDIVKFKLLRDGKPVKAQKIFGSTEGFLSDNDIGGAFWGTTDLKGEFEFKALKPGKWYVKVNINEDSGDVDCERTILKSSFSFEVK